MGAPDYRAVLSGMSECLPDAQAARNHYFLAKVQSSHAERHFSPGAQYASIAHLIDAPLHPYKRMGKEGKKLEPKYNREETSVGVDYLK